MAASAAAASSSATAAASAASRKTILFVRHAESAYNAFKFSPTNWLTLRALKDPMIFDPPLSPKGVNQLVELGALCEHHKVVEHAQLVIVSPLKRALDTALAVMGKQFNPALVKQQQTFDFKPRDPINGKAAAEAGYEQSAAAHYPYPVPILVSALCTEVLDTSADIGSPPSALKHAYPHIDFSELSDSWWYYEGSDPRSITDEPPARVQERVMAFKHFLANRPETFIVVVTHSSFIRHCTGATLKIPNCAVQECVLECVSSNERQDVRLTVTRTRLTVK